MIEAAIGTFLTSLTAINATVGDRIYFAVIPEGTEGCAVTYEPITQRLLPTLEGTNGLRMVRMQIVASSESLLDALTVRNTIETAVLALKHTTVGGVGIQAVGPTVVGNVLYQPETKRYRAVRDYEIWYEGSAT